MADGTRAVHDFEVVGPSEGGSLARKGLGLGELSLASGGWI